MKTGSDGRVVMVTGAAGGLGSATARVFASEGAEVIMVDRDGERVTGAAREIGASCTPFSVDVTSETEVAGLVGEVLASKGRLDVLVHCAGISRGRSQQGSDGWLPMERVSLEDWNTVIETNLTATFLVDREAVQPMIRQRWGRIINVASISALVANRGLAGLGPYSASKGGVVSLTKVLAAEWARYNITVNSISPGYMATEMGTRSQTIPGFRELQLELSPQGRLGEPDEFAHAALYLASDRAAHVTGHNLVIDGGYTVW